MSTTTQAAPIRVGDIVVVEGETGRVVRKATVSGMKVVVVQLDRDPDQFWQIREADLVEGEAQ